MIEPREIEAGAPRVLVADDDSNIRLMARAALEPAGFEIHEAPDGRSALETIEALRPEIVLLDLVMPEIDGFEVCARAREIDGMTHMSIVIMTGHADHDSIRRAYEAGATDFVTKPVDWELLRHRVRYQVRASRAFRAADEAQRVARLGNWEWYPERGEFRGSEEALRILGITGNDGPAGASRFLECVHEDDRLAVESKRQMSVESGTSYAVEYRTTTVSGGVRFILERGEPVSGGRGVAPRVVGTVQDVTEKKQAEEEIIFLAYHDSLTGLANRRAFKEQLERVLQRAQRGERTVGVLYLDLDSFKRINDTHGHDVGDAVLRTVAKRVESCIRRTDHAARIGGALTGADGGPGDEGAAGVARLGGDEFIVILDELRHAEDAARVAERIVEVVSAPLETERGPVRVTPSIGITLFPQDGATMETILKNADIAMYHAKKMGRNNYQFFTEKLNARARQRLVLEHQLQGALDRGELQIHYQPIVRLSTGAIATVEAFLRWIHPTEGVMLPPAFIPVMEQSGMIDRVGEWLLRQACLQCKEWQERGLARLHVAVGVSAAQFRRGAFAEVVARALDHSGLDPRCLELEFTEAVLTEETTAGTTALNEIVELGARVVVDDFGIGYSSLRYLKRLPLDILKIDRSFVEDVSSDTNVQSIVAAIIAMAHNLDLEATGEGVETEAQRRMLRDNGCDLAQGDLFAPPAAASEIEKLLVPDVPWAESA